MRDGAIYNMKSSLDHKVAALYQQVNFLNLRFIAYENILNNRWTMLKAIFTPSKVQTLVNNEHIKLLKDHEKEVMERMKAMKEESAKPKIQLVAANGMPKLAALVALLLLQGCVSLRTHEMKKVESYQAGYEAADKECTRLQVKLGAYVTSLQERLRKFNQLNEDGSLRTKTNDDSKDWSE